MLRAIARRALAHALLLAPLAASFAAEFPQRPIRFVTGSAPGGGSDFVARILAERLAERLGQNVLVDNRAGAGGTIGADIVAKSTADGYTWLVATGSGIVVNPSLQRLPYDVERDFAAVSQISRAPFVLAVNPGVPAKSVADLIQVAKSRPRQLSYASSGIGSMAHLSMELWKGMAQVDLVHVPYKGSSLAALDLISGQVQAAFNNIIPTLPHVRSGRLRALGVSGPARSPALPEIPTVAESGLAGYESMQWYALLTASRVPAAITERMHRELIAVLKLPAVRARLTDEGGDVVGSTPAELSAYIRAETAKWSKVIKAARITAGG